MGTDLQKCGDVFATLIERSFELHGSYINIPFHKATLLLEKGSFNTP
jgi:hypothetical protein